MGSCDGALVMVVEYLESNMSRELLGKFPDNSRYDFDYTQSSIWSPLVPRPPVSASSRVDLSCGLSRKLFSGVEKKKKKKKNATLNKLTATIKSKISRAVLDNLHKYQRIKKSKNAAAIHYSPLPSSHKLASTSRTPKKGWGKVLKAASKQFKKKNKKKDFTSAQINLSSCFRDGDFEENS